MAQPVRTRLGEAAVWWRVAPVWATLLMAIVMPLLPARANLADTVALVRPSVVIVGTYRATDSPRFRLRGTGFVAGSGNTAITNAHVLPDTSENQDGMSLVIQVRGAQRDLSMRGATVLAVDRVHDLALLRFDGAPVPAMVIRDSDTVREGQSVAFTGFPIGGALGFSPVTHRGTISSIVAAAVPAPTARQLTEATIRGARAGDYDVFQLDGTAYPGNSGGPLFDPDTGAVLGVVNMVLLKGTREGALSQPSGISYAIPSKYILQLLERAGIR